MISAFCSMERARSVAPVTVSRRDISRARSSSAFAPSMRAMITRRPSIARLATLRGR